MLAVSLVNGQDESSGMGSDSGSVGSVGAYNLYNDGDDPFFVSNDKWDIYIKDLRMEMDSNNEKFIDEVWDFS